MASMTRKEQREIAQTLLRRDLEREKSVAVRERNARVESHALKRLRLAQQKQAVRRKEASDSAMSPSASTRLQKKGHFHKVVSASSVLAGADNVFVVDPLSRPTTPRMTRVPHLSERTVVRERFPRRAGFGATVDQQSSPAPAQGHKSPIRDKGAAKVVPHEEHGDPASIHDGVHFRDEGEEVTQAEIFIRPVLENLVRWMIPIVLTCSVLLSLFLTQRTNHYLVAKSRHPCFSSTNPFHITGLVAPGSSLHGMCDEIELWPCPPRAVCQSGALVQCNSIYWVPNKVEPTSCVLSDIALSMIALVQRCLEKWSGSCAGGGMLNVTNASPVPYRQAAGVPMHPYDAVIKELMRDLPKSGYDEMIRLKEEIFADISRGRFSILWELDDSGAQSLWIGLHPNHDRHLPVGCRAAKDIVESIAIIRQVLTFPVVIGIFSGLCVTLQIAAEAVWVILLVNPAVLSLFATAFAGIIWIWQSTVRKRSREALAADIEVAHRTALDILKHESVPLRCLALRDAVRERIQGDFDHASRFHGSVWRTVQARLENDERIQLRLVRQEPCFLWSGPKANENLRN